MPICPHCGSSNFIPIIYGEPSPELFEKAEKGEILLGGCEIPPDKDNYQCKDCGNYYK